MIEEIFVLAVEQSILINEVAWMGDTDNWRNEWVEIYNQSKEEINLNGWQILIDQKITPLSGIIKPQSFLVIKKPKGGLNNKGGSLTLLDSSHNIADELDFSSGWTAGDNETKRTMERTLSGWQTSLLANGSPGNENPKPIKNKEKISDINILNREEKFYPEIYKILFRGVITSSFITVFILYLNLKLKNNLLKN